MVLFPTLACCMFFRSCQHLNTLDKVLSFRTLNDINKNADTSELFIEKLDPGLKVCRRGRQLFVELGHVKLQNM